VGHGGEEEGKEAGKGSQAYRFPEPHPFRQEAAKGFGEVFRELVKGKGQSEGRWAEPQVLGSVKGEKAGKEAATHPLHKANGKDQAKEYEKPFPGPWQIAKHAKVYLCASAW
jgi:hypothetical protein